MTFWDAMAGMWNWAEARFTRGLGVAGGTITTLLATGIIPPAQVVYYLAVLNVLTYWRGEATGTTYQVAKAVVATTKQVTAEAPPPATPAAAAIITASQIPATSDQLSTGSKLSSDDIDAIATALAAKQPSVDVIAATTIARLAAAQKQARERATPLAQLAQLAQSNPEKPS